MRRWMEDWTRAGGYKRNQTANSKTWNEWLENTLVTRTFACVCAHLLSITKQWANYEQSKWSALKSLLVLVLAEICLFVAFIHPPRSKHGCWKFILPNQLQSLIRKQKETCPKSQKPMRYCRYEILLNFLFSKDALNESKATVMAFIM